MDARAPGVWGPAYRIEVRFVAKKRVNIQYILPQSEIHPWAAYFVESGIVTPESAPQICSKDRLSRYSGGGAST
jgi:hypothetical protein